MCFEYALDFANFEKIRSDFKVHHIEETIEFLKKHHKAYFNIKRKIIDINNTDYSIDIEDSKVQKVINVQTISAKRDVSNVDGDDSRGNKTLSKLSYRYFKPFENSQAPHVIKLQQELIKADGSLTKSYEDIFKKVTEDIERFSYNASKISIKSNFQEVNLLKENTSVGYDEEGFHLPEDYNGLGYMNLFAMIFELHIIFDEFNRTHKNSEPADINLLFIEEPEAHTHPQMQYIFIKNIKDFLKDNSATLNLQTIITTHSAHITSQGDCNDIKYFLNKKGEVSVKNLADLGESYENNEEGKANFKFLKQYLTLQGAELFFSDKIIFIEGDTERILLAAIMRKLDLENKDVEGYIPLLSQKISFIEAGAHSKVFDKFLEFLEIKTLIITDLDSVDAQRESCKVVDSVDTSNSSIKHFLPDKKWTDLISMQNADRIILRGVTPVYIAYQTEENNYHARSFEDAFISLNLDFLKNNKDKFDSLKHKEKLEEDTNDFFDMASSCVKKKTDFAIDILFYTNEEFTSWKTPDYINQGLLWLMQE